MIDPKNGTVYFTDGLALGPSTHVADLGAYQKVNFKISQWHRHLLGFHSSEYGEFEVESISTASGHLALVMLRHRHEFYDLPSLNDTERDAFHQSVIVKDLSGQKEYTWGIVKLLVDPEEGKSSIFIIYTPESVVPLGEREVLKTLSENMGW